MHQYTYNTSANFETNASIVQTVIKYLYNNPTIDEDSYQQALFQDLTLAIETQQWKRRLLYVPKDGEIMVTSKERINEVLQEAEEYFKNCSVKPTFRLEVIIL